MSSTSTRQRTTGAATSEAACSSAAGKLPSAATCAISSRSRRPETSPKSRATSSDSGAQRPASGSCGDDGLAPPLGPAAPGPLERNGAVLRECGIGPAHQLQQRGEERVVADDHEVVGLALEQIADPFGVIVWLQAARGGEGG